MAFESFLPSDVLKPYIKCYWIFKAEQGVSDQIMFPSGYVEFAINISGGHVTTCFGDRAVTMPGLEVLGHFNIPTKVTAVAGTTVLITRFQPYAVASFFSNHISDFTNESIDLCDVIRQESADFFGALMERKSIAEKINYLESFLIRQLKKGKVDHQKLRLVESICRLDCNAEKPFNIRQIASQYGFSERYIQKLFHDLVGITPKDFFKVQRFNKSLDLIRTSGSSLTSIATQCGYYDQAHFIREFKSYTGLSPSRIALGE